MPERQDHDQDSDKRRNDDGEAPNDSRGPDTPTPGPPNMLSRNFMGVLVLGGLAILLVFLLTNAGSQAKQINATEFMQHAKDGNFEGPIEVSDNKLEGELKPDTEGMSVKPGAKSKPLRVFADITPGGVMEGYVDDLKEAGIELNHHNPSIIWMAVLVNSIPILLIAFLIWFFVIRSFRSAGGGPGGMLGNFGRSRHKVTNKEHSSITLTDVAGVDEAKDEVSEIIEFLKEPKQFQRLGGRVPRGVLLIGQPGCGKTLLAKAVAGEADVPFFSISGSDFVEMFVGVGASRVRDLFKQAKDSSPCIIFLDEIDAVGRRRGNGFTTGGHDEREQTLNAILVEMDGFETNDQVIVVAATNRADVLDPALTRPGRFDRQIHVPLPDIAGRVGILKVHSRKVKISPDVDLERLARGTPLFSGADLEAVINEAAIGATLQNKEFIEMDDLEEARDKVKWGRARKSHKIEDDERKVIAYHEAGHAVCMYYDQDSEPLHKVTIIPRGQALGVTFMLPEKDKHIHTKKQLHAQLRVTFGGRIAEEMFCDDVSSGAASDIRQATAIAKAMVTEYGMSNRLGFQGYGADDDHNPWEMPGRDYSDETAALIDSEMKAIIDQMYDETRTLLKKHSDHVENLAQALLKYETLSREEVERIFDGEPLNKATVSDLLKAEQEKIPDTAPAKTEPAPPIDDAPGAMPSPA
jgi:cell division protease FtsH